MAAPFLTVHEWVECITGSRHLGGGFASSPQALGRLLLPLLWDGVFSEPHVGYKGVRHPEPLLSIPPRSLLLQLVSKDKRKIQPRKTSTMTAPRRPGQAEGKDPKKPSESKKNPPNPGEVKKGSRKPGEGRTATPKPGAAKKAPKKGQQNKDQEARLGEAKKSSQQPDKATQAPPIASGPGGKSEVKGGRSNQGMDVNGVRGGHGRGFLAATGHELGWRGQLWGGGVS